MWGYKAVGKDATILASGHFFFIFIHLTNYEKSLAVSFILFLFKEILFSTLIFFINVVHFYSFHLIQPFVVFFFLLHFSNLNLYNYARSFILYDDSFALNSHSEGFSSAKSIHFSLRKSTFIISAPPLRNSIILLAYFPPFIYPTCFIVWFLQIIPYSFQCSLYWESFFTITLDRDPSYPKRMNGKKMTSGIKR